MTVGYTLSLYASDYVYCRIGYDRRRPALALQCTTQ